MRGRLPYRAACRKKTPTVVRSAISSRFSPVPPHGSGRPPGVEAVLDKVEQPRPVSTDGVVVMEIHYPPVFAPRARACAVLSVPLAARPFDLSTAGELALHPASRSVRRLRTVPRPTSNLQSAHGHGGVWSFLAASPTWSTARTSDLTRQRPGNIVLHGRTLRTGAVGAAAAQLQELALDPAISPAWVHAGATTGQPWCRGAFGGADGAPHAAGLRNPDRSPLPDQPHQVPAAGRSSRPPPSSHRSLPRQSTGRRWP